MLSAEKASVVRFVDGKTRAQERESFGPDRWAGRRKAPAGAGVPGAQRSRP